MSCKDSTDSQNSQSYCRSGENELTGEVRKHAQFKLYIRKLLKTLSDVHIYSSVRFQICGYIPGNNKKNKTHTHTHKDKSKVKHNSVFPSVKNLSSELDLRGECSWRMLLFEFLAVTVCYENCKTKNTVRFGIVESLEIESAQHMWANPQF